MKLFPRLFSLNKKLSTQPPSTMKPSANGSTSDKNLSKEQQIENLLKEYELCTIDANHLEDSIWTATSILIAATGAGIGFLGTSAPKNVYEFSIHLIVAAFSLFIVRIWYKIVILWHEVQSKIYYRSEDIEKILNICKNKEIRDVLLDMKKNRKKGYSVSDSFVWIRRILVAVWISFPVIQGLWYVAQVTGISNSWWLSIK